VNPGICLNLFTNYQEKRERAREISDREEGEEIEGERKQEERRHTKSLLSSKVFFKCSMKSWHLSSNAAMAAH
jgi:hypothetical protein